MHLIMLTPLRGRRARRACGARRGRTPSGTSKPLAERVARGRFGMPDTVTIAVDAMGGDDAPGVVLEGVEGALSSDPALRVVLCGPGEVVEPFAAVHERCVARVASEVIGMAEHPAGAVRAKKDSSIVVGCRLVKEGAADGFFSAGSTGACLAAGTLVMGRVRGIARPALATVIPVAGEACRHERHRSERRLQAGVPRAVRPDGVCLREKVVASTAPGRRCSTSARRTRKALSSLRRPPSHEGALGKLRRQRGRRRHPPRRSM